MDEFPRNSQRKPPETPVPEVKKIQQIADGSRRKKPLGKRFAETFIGGDMKSVSNYVFWDVLIPAAKDMFSDAMSQGTDRLLYGEARRGRGGSRPANTGAGYFNYAGVSSGGKRPDPRTGAPALSRRARSTHDFDDIVIETRAQAETVIDGLYTLLDQYEQATVSDLYEMVGITATPSDLKWGWTTLPGARAERIKGGYLLDLPKPEPLD